MRRNYVPALVFVATASVLACRPVSSADVAAQRADRAAFSGGSATEVSRSCVVTGVETCFNAIDDNCNGLVDEGCGLKTGMIQLLAAWDEASVDVDLALELPSGAVIDKSNRNRDSFALDRDCPKDGCSDQNEEGIVFAGGEPAAGEYNLTVKLARPADLTADGVNVHVGGRLGTHSHAATVRLTVAHPSEVLKFVL
jgi:tRNA (guanosine-2'-O-)-methyltransferase